MKFVGLYLSFFNKLENIIKYSPMSSIHRKQEYVLQLSGVYGRYIAPMQRYSHWSGVGRERGTGAVRCWGGGGNCIPFVVKGSGHGRTYKEGYRTDGWRWGNFH